VLYIFQLPALGPFEAGVRCLDELKACDAGLATEPVAESLAAFEDVQGEESLQVEVVDQRFFDEPFGVPGAEPCGNVRIVIVFADNAAVFHSVSVEKCSLSVEQTFLPLENPGHEVIVLHQVAHHDGHVVPGAEGHDTLAHDILVGVLPVRIACGVEYRHVTAIASSGGNRIGHLSGFHDK